MARVETAADEAVITDGHARFVVLDAAATSNVDRAILAAAGAGVHVAQR
ncbi:hypothetical protein [Mycobacterium paraense]|nr:hypothetical protein [Mycobacterium paraense]